MATRIPMQGTMLDSLLKGVNTGRNLYATGMHPILEREKQKQLESHFQQQNKLAQMQAARMARAAEDAHKIALNKLNPLYEAEQFEALKNYWKNKNKNIGMQNAENGANAGISQNAKPNPQFGEGQVEVKPEGMEENSQIHSTENQMPANPAANTMPAPTKGGLSQEDMQLIRENPQLRGYYKKHFGYDPLMPLPETPEEKHAGAINQAISIDEAKANRKKIDEIEKTAQALLPYLGKVNTIEDILKRKPNLTGRTTQLADLLGMTKDEDVGKFLSAAQALQAHMAKEMSSRGGYGVSKLVEQAKPNYAKSSAYNTGVVKELKEGMRNSFNQLASEYKRLTGKKLPYDFEQYFQEETGMGGNIAKPAGNKKRLKFNPITGRLE